MISDKKKMVITLVTTPGTEFKTGKSNDLVILKNLEKHDIFLNFFVDFDDWRGNTCFTGSTEGINDCLEFSKCLRISIKIIFIPFPRFTDRSTFQIRFNVTSGINTLHFKNYFHGQNWDTNTGKRHFSCCVQKFKILYVIIDWSIIFFLAFDRFWAANKNIMLESHKWNGLVYGKNKFNLCRTETSILATTIYI